MNIRAVVFDVYGTLLKVSPSPSDVEHRWRRLWQETWNRAPNLTLAKFGAACDQVIQQRHSIARSQGIQWPEVFWPDVAGKVLPELNSLSQSGRDDFLYLQAQTWHSVDLFPGAADTLRYFQQSGLCMGIASNAQPYTLRELNTAMASEGLSSNLFLQDLVFWSFHHGFSKPNPHVFQILSARLKARGIGPEQALMIGDRMDNDIEPARNHGWKTWLLTETPISANSGSWLHLLEKFKRGFV